MNFYNRHILEWLLISSPIIFFAVAIKLKLSPNETVNNWGNSPLGNVIMGLGFMSNSLRMLFPEIEHNYFIMALYPILLLAGGIIESKKRTKIKRSVTTAIKGRKLSRE